VGGPFKSDAISTEDSAMRGDRLDDSTTPTKTWGPFTGRQLTTIICVVAVMALFPVGAWAVAGSNSFVTDATTGKHATVDSEGQLHVVANVAGAKSWVRSGANSLSNSYAVRVTPPAGKAFVLRQLHLDWFGADAAADPYISWGVGVPTCVSMDNSSIELVDLSSGQDNRVVTFDPGYIVPAGKALCALKHGNGTFYLNAYGYYVPSTAVSSSGIGELSTAAVPH
jgi:hypothetical protein